MLRYIPAMLLAFIGLGAALPAPPALGQQSAINTPYSAASSRFFENYGVQWGYRGNGFFFRGPGLAPIPFAGGGLGAGSPATFGFSRGGFSFGLSAMQGSDRSMVAQSASVTVPNGGSGYIASGAISPFVMGWTPVVGDAPQLINPVHLALARWQQMQAEGYAPNNTAQQTAPLRMEGSSETLQADGANTSPDADHTDSAGAQSLAELRQAARSEDHAQRQEGLQWLQRARQAESADRLGAARVYYQRAARNSAGVVQEEAQRALKRLLKE